MLKKKNKKGFLSVEAAIFLPLFVIAILCIAYFMKLARLDDSVCHAMVDESMKAATFNSEYVLPFYLSDRLEEKDEAGLSDLTKEKTRLIPLGDSNYELKADYELSLRLPISFFDKFERSRLLIFRSFSPTQNKDGDDPGFDKDDEEAEYVIIFPRYGIRYHREDCIYIKFDSKIEKIEKSDAIERGYTACKVCGG